MSAANILVSHKLKIERKCDIVFTIAPDGGDRYISRLWMVILLNI